jgi:hypothetical protein
MRKITRTSVLAASCCILSIPQLNAQEEVVYHERFVNTTQTGELWPAEKGWFSFVFADSAIDISENSDAIENFQLGNSPWLGVEISFDDNDFGFMAPWRWEAEPYEIIVATEVPISRTGQEITQVTWYMAKNANAVGSDAPSRLMVKISDQWYASEATFQNTTGTTHTDWELQTFEWTTAASEWRTVTVNPGENFSRGDLLASDLPSGDIQGIGWYHFQNVTTAQGHSVLWDELMVYAEPAENGGGGDKGPGPFSELDLVDGQFVDTGDWLGGFVDVSGYPWCYVFSLSKYVFFTDSGDWVYVPR